MNYTLRNEDYYMPATTYDNRHVGGARFTHAIRRNDGTLVFRAQSYAKGRELLRALERELEERRGR